VWRRQVGLVRGTRWPTESSVAAWWQERRDEVMNGFLVEPLRSSRDYVGAES
jgi:hypothetical protein